MSNIVESGVKHHNSNLNVYFRFYMMKEGILHSLLELLW